MKRLLYILELTELQLYCIQVSSLSNCQNLHDYQLILVTGAVYKGKTLNRNIIHISVPSVDHIEARIREAEQAMGIR